MTISTNQNILSMLKIYYKEGVENLLFRNSPVLKEVKKDRVEGKAQNFSAMYGRGGAVGGNFIKAKANAESVSKNVEFSVTPGQIFSVYTMNAKQVQASKTLGGAYMKVAGRQMFACSEAFRKTMALALYGDGSGFLQASGYTTAIVAGTPFNLTLSNSNIMKIDVGSKIALKATATTSATKATLEVLTINGTVISVTSDTAVSAPLATDALCLDGSLDASGEKLLPMGLEGWLPTVGNRTGATWNTFIATSFFGVNRSIATDRLAGQFHLGTGGETKSVSVQTLLSKVRRAGSLADMIIMNDEDFLAFSAEIESTNTYFTQTSTKERKNASVGFSEFSASFSTSFIENIIDDPYCPKGTFYILDSGCFELWSYTNAEKLNDGIAGNNAGKQDPMTMDGEGQEQTNYNLIVADYLNVAPGADSTDGPSTAVTLQFFGSFVITNPSVCGVGKFA